MVLVVTRSHDLIASTRSFCITVKRLTTYLGTQISYDVSLQTSFYLVRHLEFGIMVSRPINNKPKYDE